MQSVYPEDTKVCGYAFRKHFRMPFAVELWPLDGCTNWLKTFWTIDAQRESMASDYDAWTGNLFGNGAFETWLLSDEGFGFRLGGRSEKMTLLFNGIQDQHPDFPVDTVYFYNKNRRMYRNKWEFMLDKENW